MKTVFADSYYFLALWNPQDKGHAKAVAFTAAYHDAVLTTDWIVTELADALARPPQPRAISEAVSHPGAANGTLDCRGNPHLIERGPRPLREAFRQGMVANRLHLFRRYEP